jgi:hypothetical protein
MATQTVEFVATSGQGTLTLRLFPLGNDTEQANASGTEQANRLGTYLASFTDLPPGLYKAVAFDADVAIATGYVRTAAAETVYVARADLLVESDLREVLGDPEAAQVLRSSLRVQARGAVVAADSAANSEVSFDTNLPQQPADYYRHVFCGFTAGGENPHQSRLITASADAGSNTRLTVSPGFEEPPEVGDEFIVLGASG